MIPHIQVPNIDDRLNHHFVAFAAHDGTLYEFDGRKPFPIPHGATTDASFLKVRSTTAFITLGDDVDSCVKLKLR